MRKLVLAISALLVLALPGYAQVNPNNLPANTVVGRLGVGTGPAQAIPISTLSTQFSLNNLCTTSGAFPVYNASTGSWICSTIGTPGTAANLNGGSLTVNPTAGFFPAITTNQTLSGTLTTNQVYANLFNVNTDTADASGVANTAVNVLGAVGNVGGAGMKGTRNALFGAINLTATPTVAGNYVGAELLGEASASAGGTNLTTGVLGAVFGANPVAQLVNSSATNFASVVGIEVDAQIVTGASAKNKVGAAVVELSTDNVQGASYDTAIGLYNQGGAPGWKAGISFGGFVNPNGSTANPPLVGTGTAIVANGAQTWGSGVDFSAATITNNFLLGPGSHFSVAGSGNLSVSTATSTPISITSSLGGTINDQFSNTPATGAANDNVTMLFNFSQANGTQYNGVSIEPIQLVPTAGAQSTAIVFGTVNAGAALSEKMRLTPNGHLAFSNSAPTNNACAGFALGTGSQDSAGKLTYTSATTCNINFGSAYTNPPFCVVQSAAAQVTSVVTTTTSVMSVTFSAVNTAFSWICMGL